MSRLPRKAPFLANWLLSKCIGAAQYEEFLGDLEEMYEERLLSNGKLIAYVMYWVETLHLVVGFFSPNVFQTKDTSISKAMILHNTRLTFRGFKRFKASFAINLVGLSSGLAAAFLIFLWINDELSIDTFHANDRQLYQVMQNLNRTNGVMTTASTPVPLARALEEEMSEIEMATTVGPVGLFGSSGILQYEDKVLKVKEQYADRRFFEVFSFPLLRGDPNKVLKTKQDVVISEHIANALFGMNSNPIGRSIIWKEREGDQIFVVSGVFKKLPANSSQKFDLVLPIEEILEERPYLTEWSNNDPSTFVVLKENANAEKFSEQIKNFIARKRNGYRHTLFLQKYSERYLYGSYENGAIAGGRIQYVKLFSIIAGLVLLIACINFMNLSTARASRRLKEIGVKKALGARRHSLISQYMTEAILITFISVFMAGVVVYTALPTFNLITGKLLLIHLNWSLFGWVLVIGLVTALLAGSYPALYLSGFDPISIFKGKISGSSSDLWARRGLVVFQFSISVMLISSVLIISSQIDYIKNKNLGFDREHIIYFNSDGELRKDNSGFINELRKESTVINAASFGHDFLGEHGNTSGVKWEGKSPDNYTEFGNLEVGYNLIETFGLEMVEGRTFSPDFGDETGKIIFNEKAVEVMGLENPIGKVVSLWGKDKEIIGVVKNFHFESLHEEIKPNFFQYYPGLSSIVVRVQAGTEQYTVERIKEIYQAYNPGLAFSFNLFDQEYDALYRSEQQVASLSRAFGAIAILISCLGLFGLVSFATEKRQKEIGIRKVLGSSTYNLVFLLTSDFSKMVAIALLISLPSSYFIMKYWLDSFAYRIQLDVWLFIGSGIFSLLIAWITMSFQTIKAAKANPVKSLKYE